MFFRVLQAVEPEWPMKSNNQDELFVRATGGHDQLGIEWVFRPREAHVRC